MNRSGLGKIMWIFIVKFLELERNKLVNNETVLYYIFIYEFITL